MQAEAFHGLRVPEGSDRRNLYTSQIRTIFTYKMSLSDLDTSLREVLSSDGWTIVMDERRGFSGRLDVSKTKDVNMDPQAVVHIVMESCSNATMSALKYYIGKYIISKIVYPCTYTFRLLTY